MVHICICIHVVHSNQARPHENRKSYHASVSRFLLAQKCFATKSQGYCLGPYPPGESLK